MSECDRNKNCAECEALRARLAEAEAELRTAHLVYFWAICAVAVALLLQIWNLRGGGG